MYLQYFLAFLERITLFLHSAGTHSSSQMCWQSSLDKEKQVPLAFQVWPDGSLPMVSPIYLMLGGSSKIDLSAVPELANSCSLSNGICSFNLNESVHLIVTSFFFQLLPLGIVTCQRSWNWLTTCAIYIYNRLTFYFLLFFNYCSFKIVHFILVIYSYSWFYLHQK